MSNATLAACVMCHKHTYVQPLHDDKGGPLTCPICAGKWHAKHTRRRKWGRIIIKAMKFYQREGGHWADLDKLKLVAGGIIEEWGIDPLGYGNSDTIGAEVGDITAELLADTIEFTHPDKHPPEREEKAKRVTQELLALKPFVFPAPKPEPVKPQMRRDTSSKIARRHLKDPSQPTYPCEACADTWSYYYCDPCRAEWEKRQQKERDRNNARQREWYAHRQRWRKLRLETCEGCREQFKGKRKDAKYCSAACRQRSYRKRKSVQINSGGNSLPSNSCDAEGLRP